VEPSPRPRESWARPAATAPLPPCDPLGVQASINSMALPPVMKYGPPHMRDSVARAVITGHAGPGGGRKPAAPRRSHPHGLGGEKNICLAISEPTAGSDVANIRAEAAVRVRVRVEARRCHHSRGALTPAPSVEAVREGDHYIVNGEKKWITGGLWADWFTLCCRTGGPGGSGLSLILVPADTPGIKALPPLCATRDRS
jgi:alkylation response protein AidB-like acyl-CoA dehydrogenase